MNPTPEKENIVKNQHYISSSLLANFANSDGKLFEVLFLGDNNKIYPTNIEDSMSAKFTYEHEDLRINTIEDYFSTKETIASPKVNKLINLINAHKINRDSIAEIKLLVEDLLPTFIIFYYRSGALLTEFSSIKSEDKIPLLSKKILNELYLNTLAETIKIGYKFAIIESNDEFLLSDQYISTAALKIKSNFIDVSNRHIGLKETLILIPISSQYYVAYWHSDEVSFLKEDSLNFLKEEMLKDVNRAIINNSYSKCVAKNKSSIENVIDSYRMHYPSQVYLGYQSGYTSGAIRKKEVFFYEIDKKAYRLFQDVSFGNYVKLRVNDKCACGSKKKFKKCHLYIYERIKTAVYNLINRDSISQNIYKIPNTLVTELPVDSWGGFSEKLKEVKDARKNNL